MTESEFALLTAAFHEGRSRRTRCPEPLMVWFCHHADDGGHKRCPVVAIGGDYLEVRFGDGVREWIEREDVFAWERRRIHSMVQPTLRRGGR